jgi:hypothetical protein
VQARLGYSGVAMLACRIGDRDGGEQASGGTERSFRLPKRSPSDPPISRNAPSVSV